MSYYDDHPRNKAEHHLWTAMAMDDRHNKTYMNLNPCYYAIMLLYVKSLRGSAT